MHMPVALALTVVFSIMVSLGGISHARADQKPSSAKDVKSLSKEKQIELALSAAPPHIAKDASVLAYGTDGQLTEAKKGTNGFICVPSVMNLPEPDPMCMDAAAHQWLTDLVKNAPKPTNTVPGIAYMARGGSHFEKDGQVVMGAEGAQIVQEPPHQMIMWPFDAAKTKMPTVPNPSGFYVMFAGTPYAHVMVYQDPMKMKQFKNFELQGSFWQGDAMSETRMEEGCSVLDNVGNFLLHAARP